MMNIHPEKPSSALQAKQTALTPLGSCVNGCLTSLFTMSLCHPLFTIKTRLMSGLPLPKSFSLMYAGYGANVSSDMASQAVAFLAFNFFAHHIMGGKELSYSENFLGGLLAGITSSPLISGLERVMILQQVAPVKRQSTMLKVCQQISQQEGWRGFMRGLGPTLVRETLNCYCFFGLSQLVEDKIKKYIENKNAACAIAYLISGATAGLLTAPADVIKTRMQNQIGATCSLQSCLKTIALKDLLSGALPRSLSISSTMMCMGLISHNLPIYFPKALYIESASKV